jgi:hypothetical protein
MALADQEGNDQHWQGDAQAVAMPALADQQGNPPGGWTERDVEQHAAGPVSRRKAHEYLAQWRSENQRGTLDLTGRRNLFDWVSYLGYHPDRKMIFAGGRRVTSFHIMRIDAVMDTNTRDARVDFVIRLSDGMVVRLHPGSKSDAKPVVVTGAMGTPQVVRQGQHEAAAPPPPGGKGNVKGKAGGGGKGKGAPGKGEAKGKAGGGKGHVLELPEPPWDQGAAAPAEMRSHFEGISQADLIPTRAVKNWASWRLEEAGRAGTQFRLNLTAGGVGVQGWRTGVFLWYLWFNSEERLRNHVPLIVEIWMVKAGDEPGFWFREQGGNEFLVRFWGNGVAVEAGRGNFGRQIDWHA